MCARLALKGLWLGAEVQGLVAAEATACASSVYCLWQLSPVPPEA
jgi:hypothetical protein